MRCSANSFDLTDKLKIGLLPALALALLSSVPAGNALAEEGDGASGNQLEEVIVQAQRRDESLQTVPVAVSALSQDGLDKLNVVDLNDLNNAVPGLVIATPADQTNSRIHLRGVGTTNGTESGDQAVGFYVDGIFAARAQGALSLFYDLENVQVLRGPQGTLFGRNTSAGAILVRTKRPTDELEGEFELTTGSYNRRRIYGAMSIPLTDKWGLRIAGIYDVDDGWVEQQVVDPRVPSGTFEVPPNLNPQDGSEPSNPYSLDAVNRFPNPNLNLNNRDSRSVRISSLAQLTDRTSWFFSVENFVNNSGGAVVLDPVLVNQGRYEAYIDSPHSLELISTAARSIFTVELSESISMQWLFGYASFFRSQVYDGDAGIGSFYREHRTEWHNSRSISSEFTFSGSHSDGKFDWTAGLYNFAERGGIRFDIDTTTSWPDGGATFIQPERGADAGAVFGQFTYRPIESLGLTAGLRYTTETKIDRRGRNYAEGFCGGEVIRRNPVNALDLRRGAPDKPLRFLEDFFDNATGERTRNLGGGGIEGAPEPDRLDDRTGLPLDFVDEDGDGLDDVTGSEFIPACIAVTQNELEREYNQLSWMFRVDYTVGERNPTLLYVSAGTGYQSGVIQDNGNSTDPELSLNYEFGTKTDFENVRLNTALFFSTFDDLIRSTIHPIQNNTVVVNASQAQIFGAEIEMTALFGSGGRIDAALSILNATYSEEYITSESPSISSNLPRGANPDLRVEDRGLDSNGDPIQFYDVNGATLPYAPTIQFTMGFSWNIALDKGTLTPRFGTAFTSDVYFTDRNTQFLEVNNIIAGVDQGENTDGTRRVVENPEGEEGYFTVDVGLEWAGYNGFSLDVFLNNATSQVAKISTDCGDNKITREGCAARYLTPAEFGIRLRWQFD